MDSTNSTDTGVDWLWPNCIPLGAVSLLAGEPGVGKSLLTMDMAARLSLGAAWPDRVEENRPGSTILLGDEDSIEGTIRPRLEAAGADFYRIHHARVMSPGTRPSQLLESLEMSIRSIGDACLVVIDPFASLARICVDRLGLRSMMFDLYGLARRRRVAVVLVANLDPRTESPALHAGSLAFIAALRAAWRIERDAADPDRRVLVPLKAYAAFEPTPLAFRIADNAVRWESAPALAS